MSLVSLVYGHGFCSVMSDGLATDSFGNVLDSNMEKYIKINRRTVIGFAGSYRQYENGSNLYDVIIDFCKKAISENGIRKALNKIMEFIEELPFCEQAGKVIVAIVYIGNTKSNKNPLILRAANDPNITSGIEELTKETSLGYAVLDPNHKEGYQTGSDYLRELLIEQKELNLDTIRNCQKLLNQYISSIDETVNNQTSQIILK